MVLRSGHGNGAGSPRIEVLPPDELRCLDAHADLPLQRDDQSAWDFTAAASADDAIDVRRQLAFTQHQIEAGLVSARQAAILEADADGVPQSHVARRLNVAYKTVRNDLARARRTLRESWASYVTLVLLAIAGFVGWALRDRTPTSPPRAPTTRWPRPRRRPRSSPTACARRLSAGAPCSSGTNASTASIAPRRWTPAGDAKPWVQKAKHDAQMHRRDKPPVR